MVEIVSDSPRDKDRNADSAGIKMTDYALHSVQEYWIIDTEQEAIEQYILDGNAFWLFQKLKDDQLTAEAITGSSIRVKDVFTAQLSTTSPIPPPRPGSLLGQCLQISLCHVPVRPPAPS